MVEKPSNSFPKQERICSKRIIDKLFNGRESHAMSAYPIRVVYRFETKEDEDEGLPKVQVLMSCKTQPSETTNERSLSLQSSSTYSTNT